MRVWGWIGGGLVVLVGTALAVGLVGAPGERAVNPASAPVVEVRSRLVVAPQARSDERHRITSPVLGRIERERGDGLASEIDRQRSAMRAAVAMLVAGEHAGARIR